MDGKMEWIKLSTDIMEDDKIRIIRAMDNGAEIVLIWISLLTLCGRTNNGGILRISDRIPHTAQTLSIILQWDATIVKAALDTFEAYGMTEEIEGYITICNWSKYQSTDKYEARKEKDRIRKAEARAAKRAAISASTDMSASVRGQSTDTSADCLGTVRKCPQTEEEVEEEVEIEEEKDTTAAAAQRIDYQSILDDYNATCPSLRRCIKLTDKRRKAIRARLSSGYTPESLHDIFVRAESIPGLKGAGGRDWIADFDWLMREDKLANIAEGKYDTWGRPSSVGYSSRQSGPKYDYSNCGESF